MSEDCGVHLVECASTKRSIFSPLASLNNHSGSPMTCTKGTLPSLRHDGGERMWDLPQSNPP